MKRGSLIWPILLFGLSHPIVQAAGPGVFTSLSEASLVFPASQVLRAIDVYEGHKQATLTFVSQKENLWRSGDGTLLLSLQLEQQPDRHNWLVKLKNEGQQNAWLLVRAYVSFRPQGEWRYFNGNFSAQPRRPLVRDQLAYTMPMVAAYDSRRGLGIGLQPWQIFSYLENGISPPSEGARAGAKALSYYYGVKLVLNPQETQTIHFVTFSFAIDAREAQDPFGGERAAVAAYQGLYPQAFRPIPDGDPRLQTAGEAGSAPTWYKPSPEAVRRARARCDWSYAPVKIPGDWFGRPQFWDKYNENVADEKRLQEFYGTLEHWHQFLKDTFTRVQLDHGVAPYFYIINWAYYRLAEDEYAEAMIHDPRAQNRIGPWVTNKGPDHRLFLWGQGNKAAEQFQQDLRDIWAAYPLGGFGFDVAMGDVKYRGPYVAVSPGRAWDEEGEYCDVSVCIAKIADFVHSLPPKRYRAGFWTNGGHHIYSIAVRCDAGSFEGARYELPGLEENLRYQRYILGHKAIHLFSGDSRDRTTDFYDEENTPPEEIKQMYRRIQLAALQSCLRWGALPCGDLAAGWQETWELHDSADRELFPYPWQLQCRARAPEPLQTAQYGTGQSARFVAINPRGEAIKARIIIVGAPVLYAQADGSETENMWQGREIQIALEMAPGGVAILVPVAHWPHKKAVMRVGKWLVRRLRDPEDGYRIEIKGAKEGWEPLVPPGYEAAGDSPWHFSPRVFASPEKAILDFFAEVLPPGLPAAQAASQPSIAPQAPLSAAASSALASFGRKAIPIVIRPEAALEEKKAAEALQEYFRFYSEEIRQESRLVLPIITKAPAEKHVSVSLGKEAIIQCAGDRLIVAAPEAEILETMRQLLRLLDQRYPFYGQISRWVHQRPKETEIRQKLGLAGGTVLKDGTIFRTPLGASLFNQIPKGPAYGQPWPP